MHRVFSKNQLPHMSVGPISACIRLREADSIPWTRIVQRRFGIHLTSDEKMRSSWEGEITILGELPWCSGEERHVELRIAAKPFEDYVSCWRPTLYACLGDEIIGDLILATAS